MFVVGYTPGGAPYGWIDDSIGATDLLKLSQDGIGVLEKPAS